MVADNHFRYRREGKGNFTVLTQRWYLIRPIFSLPIQILCVLLQNEMIVLKFDFKTITINRRDMIDRELTNAIQRAFRCFSVVTIVGPRQSGKTTLCRILYGELPYGNF